jgi:ATP-dependent DNA helicase DinG
MSIKTFAEAEQVLATRLPGYTERPQQQALAAFIENVIDIDGHGLAEAGCGTGKSLGYLIPAILSGKKTVVATATIALQEQIANKDIPFLKEHLGVDFDFALLKGRSNYLCRVKAAEANPAFVPVAALMAEINADPTHDGDREHFTTPVTKEQFSQVAMSSNDCPGKKKCSMGDICFAEAAKGRAKSADVVVTNTAMLMTDLKIQEVTDGNVNMLGNYELVIVDEAHEIEEIATGALEAMINPQGIVKAIGEAGTFAAAQDYALKTDQAVAHAQRDVWALLEETFTEAQRDRKEEKVTLPLSWFMDNADSFVTMIEALRALANEIAGIRIVRGDSEKVSDAKSRLTRRIRNYATNLAEAMTTDEELMVRWVEQDSTRRDGKTVTKLTTAPVHVGSYLYEWLWSRTPALLVSATLSVDGAFTFISDRLGLPEDTQSLNVGTPFSYLDQARTFIPPANAPSPKERAKWISYAGQTMRDLITASGGGALLLFTSRSAMQVAVDTIGPWLEDEGINFFVQGVGGSNKELAKAFSEDTHSVLFALKSFFTGVDFQGDSCRLVVMDKLAFPVPTEPVFQARANQVKRHGGNDFSEMTIPMMMLTLLQGYGRLIRTVEDFGVVAILDSRLSSSGWGAKIAKGLPEAPQISTIAQVKAFYAEKMGA